MHGPGSPPRGRGKVDGPPAQVGRGRITPAQAGRSPYFLYGKKDYKDHPRIGGEKAELTAAVISAMGSPPRRRGKGYREFGIDISDRITPAQAGKSVAPRQKRSALWDHPRVGGERSGMKGMKSWKLGSPPRRRGKDKAEHLVQDHIGITPAQAGKRCYLCASTKSSWDHPRVGGEKAKITPRLKRCRGSPPRGRGKVVRPDVVAKAAGITPAWAGKRGFCNYDYYYFRDHPRVGGEKIVSVYYHTRAWGSPPRGRGKAGQLPAGAARQGITPAWAGKSAFLFRRSPLRWDHPRVGGEKPPR